MLTNVKVLMLLLPGLYCYEICSSLYTVHDPIFPSHCHHNMHTSNAVAADDCTRELFKYPSTVLLLNCLCVPE